MNEFEVIIAKLIQMTEDGLLKWRVQQDGRGWMTKRGSCIFSVFPVSYGSDDSVLELMRDDGFYWERESISGDDVVPLVTVLKALYHFSVPQVPSVFEAAMDGLRG